MKLLSKIGKIALQVTSAVLGFGPLALTAMPDKAGNIKVVLDKFSELQDVIVKAEIMGQALSLPGIDKLRMATPAVAQVILSSSLLIDRDISNPDLFRSGTTKIADGMADVMNSLKDNVDTINHA